MSAVVSFVEDVVEGIGDVIEAVGDVVENVVETVVDVVEKVGDVVQAVIEDPLPVLLSVAGSFVGIPPPLTMGAITAARGGDLEDIALSMGTAYFAPSIGNAISSTVSSTFIEAGLNETFSQVASESISKGLVNGTVAEIKGGSFEDGFAGGFTGGMVSGGVSEVASYVKPDIVELALESGLDLQDANAIYSAGTRAFSAGVTAEITGRGDFETAFANSAVGSSIDAGTRSLNNTIDEQFRTAATDWNEKDKEGEPVEVATVGAGIPNDVVTQVQVSDIGVDNTPDTNIIENTNVLAESPDTTGQTDIASTAGETATSDIAVLPEAEASVSRSLAGAPQGETVVDFAELLGEEYPLSEDVALADATGAVDTTEAGEATDVAEIPASVIDIAETTPTGEAAIASVEPKGALSTMAESVSPVAELGVTTPAVVSEAPVADNLLTAGLAQEQPAGGLNAVAQAAEATPEAKMATSMGLKPTDITKPIVATVGNLLKQSLTQKKRPAPRAPMQRPAGGLQMASARPAPRKPTPPPRMDVAKLIPIQKAAPVAQAAPAKKLASTAKLSPVTNIAGLTSLVKKTG